MKDRQLVLTGVDYKKVDDLFKQLSTSLKMFFGQQAASGHEMDSTSSIKVESACITTDVNYSWNPFWRNTGHRNPGNFRGRGDFSGRRNSNYRSGDSWNRNSSGDKLKGTTIPKKPKNPKDPNHKRICPRVV